MTKYYYKKNYKSIYDNSIMCILITIFFICIIIGAAGIAGKIETSYSMDCIIIEVNFDKILAKDITGDIWAFVGEDYTVGDAVRISFFNNYTDNTRIDDKITKVKRIKK